MCCKHLTFGNVTICDTRCVFLIFKIEMEYLWKKDRNGEYIDLFVSVQKTELFLEWNELLRGNIRWLNECNRFAKSNEKSLQYLGDGHRKCMNGNLTGALVNYNQSLCFAEAESVYEGLAYAHRAKCFVQMKRYRKALTDIRLASKWSHSKRVTLQLKMLKKKCEESLKLGLQIEQPMPKMDFKPDANFMCMANVLEIRNNAEFGRHIVAKTDIDAGKIILVTEVFASSTLSENQICCRNCNKAEQNLMPCKNCVNTMFCCGTCSERKGVHELECCSFFHVIGDTSLKLPMQTILMAIEMFPSINDLIKFVACIVNENKLPKSAKDLKSRYGLFLKLTAYTDEERIYPAYQTYTTLMLIPQLKRLFNSASKRKFLMHLTLHHISVIPQNSFHHERFNRDWVLTDYIYDVLSLINHSCVPNVFNSSTSDEIGYCITVRPIQTGEQIFINYLGNECKESVEHRQKALKTWGFDCKCAKCESQSNSNSSFRFDSVKMKTNPSYKYITQNCQKSYCKESNTDFGIRPRLKSECVNFLQQFGHLDLMPEITFVRHCFTLH